jgi:hypothetical protein
VAAGLGGGPALAALNAPVQGLPAGQPAGATAGDERRPAVDKKTAESMISHWTALRGYPASSKPTLAEILTRTPKQFSFAELAWLAAANCDPELLRAFSNPSQTDGSKINRMKSRSRKPSFLRPSRGRPWSLASNTVSTGARGAGPATQCCQRRFIRCTRCRSACAFHTGMAQMTAQGTATVSCRNGLNEAHHGSMA